LHHGITGKIIHSAEDTDAIPLNIIFREIEGVPQCVPDHRYRIATASILQRGCRFFVRHSASRLSKATLVHFILTPLHGEEQEKRPNLATSQRFSQSHYSSQRYGESKGQRHDP
jgi:hypothetical protein